MNRGRKETRLSLEEQKEKERLTRAGGPAIRKGSGRVSEGFWRLTKPEDPDGLALSNFLEDRRQGR